MYDPDLILSVVGRKMESAHSKFGPFASSHEGYGVLAEEMSELIDAIQSNDRDRVESESVDVAAVAARIAACCHVESFRVRSMMEG